MEDHQKMRPPALEAWAILKVERERRTHRGNDSTLAISGDLP